MKSAWDTTDEYVGTRIEILTGPHEFEMATVVAVSTVNGNLKVRADDGEILIGNQFEEI